jgi:DNA-binding CsgD family transcriptional regulator
MTQLEVATMPGAEWSELTPAEREVVEEVCAGRSNPQVAERLGISRRTVETHLRNIYTKLGVPTRLALAVAFYAERW